MAIVESLRVEDDLELVLAKLMVRLAQPGDEDAVPICCAGRVCR